MEYTQTSPPVSPARLSLRSGSLAARLKALANRLKKGLFPQPRQELENFLAGSVDLADLEFRLQAWERGQVRNGRYV